MIRLSGVSKSYRTRAGWKPVLSDVDMQVNAGERVGVLGMNGSGKSTLIRLIGGAEMPTSGTIERSMSVSWPLAFSGAFQTGLTGFDNLRFICRVHGVNVEEKIQPALDFSELGRKLWEPVRTYSAGMRARLAFAISLAVEFDCFLIDEIMAVGDERFQAKCEKALFVDRPGRAMLIASHHEIYVQQHCTRVSVMEQGRLIHFDSVSEAYAYYRRQQN
jgi:capsular polysaccharide transport system ATP-binding protein